MRIVTALMLLVCSTLANRVDKNISKVTRIFELPRNDEGVISLTQDIWEKVLFSQASENIGDDGKHKKLIVSLFTRQAKGSLDLGRELNKLAPIVARQYDIA